MEEDKDRTKPELDEESDIDPDVVTADAERMYVEGIRRMTPEAKIKIASEISELTRKLTRAGIRQRNPGMSEEEIEKELWRIINESRRSVFIRNKNAKPA